MKSLALHLAILAILGVAFADDSVKTFSSSLKCGACIKGGYYYCMQGAEGAVVAAGGSEPTSVCCENDSCATLSDASYNCSNSYSDKEYALSFCPQKQDKCGTKQKVEYNETGKNDSMEVKGLTDGETCSYNIKSCGASPAFKVSDNSTAADSKVNVTYYEFDESKTDMDGGKPRKNTTYENSGEQGNSTKGGQKKPPRKMKNGTMVNETTVEEEKEYVTNQTKQKNKTKSEEASTEDEGGFRPFKKKGSKSSTKGATDSTTTSDYKKREAESGTMMNETEAVSGYGKPTKGSYNSTEKGYKTFGTEGQGNNTEGTKDYGSDKSSCVQVEVSVTAVADQGSDTVFLEVGTYDFLEDYDYTFDATLGQQKAARIVFATAAIMAAIASIM